jgi:hypothetical protein
LVRFPRAFDAPSQVVERLREVDPSAELIYLGLGCWVLGSVQPHDYRARKARELRRSENALPALSKRPGLYLLTLLYEQGFRVINIYDTADVQHQAVVRDLRERDWRFRNMRDEAFAEAAKRSEHGDLETRIVQILDMVHAEFPTIHRHLFRGRRGVLNPGLN